VTDRTTRGAPLRLRRPARAVELRSIRRDVERWAERTGIPADVVVDLQLALGEAVANGIEHAYAQDAPGVVEIELALRDDEGVTVRVVDHGRWRPVPATSGNRGRGLQMIERLAARFHVRAGTTGTEVCFEIPLAA
jgi:serine/threonine-protein kinase RsbW